MNRDETKKAIEVMQAYVDGAEIECFNLKKEWISLSGSPHDIVGPSWAWNTCDFRIKPKPREWDMMVIRDGTLRRRSEHAYMGQYIKVREVIE